VSIVSETMTEWFADKAAIYAAALSFHMLLALAPLVIIAVGVVGLFFGSDTVDSLSAQAEQHLGEPAKDAVDLVLSGLTTQPAANTIAVAVGAVVMLFAAAGAFRSLRKALNAMWNVEPAPAGRDARKIGWIVFYNVMLTLMVIGLALFIAVLIGLSTLWGTLSNRLAEDTPSAEVLFRGADFLFTLLLTVCAFALLFKVVPLARIARRDLWLSATLTAVLFGIGKLGFGIYMSYSSTGSLYGAAASLVIFLIFVYYSAMIMFFGAEFAQVYGRRHGRPVQPRKGARRVVRASTPDSAI
jgi:membrane protein